MIDQLQRFAHAGALASRQWHLHGLAGVRQTFLALPDFATHLDVFLDALHGLFVCHTMEALDNLWPRGTQPEDEATIRHVVATSSSHRRKRRRARIHVDDACADFHPRRYGRQIPNLGDGVKTVRLGNPHHIQPNFFKFGHATRTFNETAGVTHHHRNFHGDANLVGTTSKRQRRRAWARVQAGLS